jgi:outer membrane protein OmpA-like peptidoglycan-associated protein
MKNIFRMAIILITVVSPNANLIAQENVDDQLEAAIQKLKPSAVKSNGEARAVSVDEFLEATQNRISVSARTDADPVKKLAVAPELENLPSVLVDISFEYNSSQIMPSQIAKLAKIGTLLNDNRLENSKLLLAGHTDASGSSLYNVILSNKRAVAIRDALVQGFDVPTSRLVTLGFGEEQLKDRVEPNSPANRRVELINLSNVFN